MVGVQTGAQRPYQIGKLSRSRISLGSKGCLQDVHLSDKDLNPANGQVEINFPDAGFGDTQQHGGSREHYLIANYDGTAQVAVVGLLRIGASRPPRGKAGNGMREDRIIPPPRGQAVALAILDQHRRGRADHSRLLLLILGSQLWADQFLREGRYAKGNRDGSVTDPRAPPYCQQLR